MKSRSNLAAGRIGRQLQVHGFGRGISGLGV